MWVGLPVTRIGAFVLVVALAATTGVVAVVAGPGGVGASPAYAVIEPAPDTSAGGTVSTPVATPTAPPPPVCPTTTTRSFVPRRITMPGIVRRALVVAPPRGRGGVPGAPALTAAGKWQFAWDRAQRVKPGDRRGNVLLNAHVWPNGSAVGNRMLARLQRGDQIVVHGTARKLCYRVTDRIQVNPWEGLRRYYNRLGRHQLAIVTCSGKRLAPGVWSKRTVWYASLRP